MVTTSICMLGRGMLNRATMDTTSTSVWEKASPPDLILKLDNLGPPHMFLAFLKQLLQH